MKDWISYIYTRVASVTLAVCMSQAYGAEREKKKEKEISIHKPNL